MGDFYFEIQDMLDGVSEDAAENLVERTARLVAMSDGILATIVECTGQSAADEVGTFVQSLRDVISRMTVVALQREIWIHLIAEVSECNGRRFGSSRCMILEEDPIQIQLRALGLVGDNGLLGDYSWFGTEGTNEIIRNARTEVANRQQ